MKSCPAALTVMKRGALTASPVSSLKMESVRNADPVSTHALNVMPMDVTCVRRGFMLMEIVSAQNVESFSRVALNVMPTNALAARKSTSHRMTSVSSAANPLITVIPVTMLTRAQAARGRKYSSRIKSVLRAVCLTYNAKHVREGTTVLLVLTKTNILRMESVLLAMASTPTVSFASSKTRACSAKTRTMH